METTVNAHRESDFGFFVWLYNVLSNQMIFFFQKPRDFHLGTVNEFAIK